MSTAFTREVVNAARRLRVSDYQQFNDAVSAARRRLKLTRPKGSRRLPHLLDDASLRRFYDAIDRAEDLQHQIMLRLLFFTAVRVSELTSIQVDAVDLAGCRIFIDQGKGSKDRYVLFPESFRLALSAHMKATPRNRYLFESRRNGPFSPRQVQRIVKGYARAAGLPVKVHPHLFRHQLISYLTRAGLTDAQIQLVSGHASKKSLEVYQHIGLADVEKGYQDAVRKLEI